MSCKLKFAEKTEKVGDFVNFQYFEHEFLIFQLSFWRKIAEIKTSTSNICLHFYRKWKQTLHFRCKILKVFEVLPKSSDRNLAEILKTVFWSTLKLDFCLHFFDCHSFAHFISLIQIEVLLSRRQYLCTGGSR